MSGRYKVKSPLLKPWHQRAVTLACHLPQPNYTVIPRENNCLADALAIEATQGSFWYLNINEK
jgi:hypothetical protein